jgi:hypothetical protein
VRLNETVNFGSWQRISQRYWAIVTLRYWNTYIVPEEDARDHGQSEKGRMWDALHMLLTSIRKCDISTNEIVFHFFFTEDGKPRIATLKAHIGPGDRGEPVLTLMMPNED